MGEPMLQVYFLRRVLDAIERHTGGRASEQLAARLQGDALRLFSSPTLRPSAPPLLGISLGDAERLLLAIDAALGERAGELLERAGYELACRHFLEASNYRADVFSCMQRLTTELTTPFVGIDVELRLNQLGEGLELYLSVPGEPRATRIWRHLCLGCLRAAFTFSFEATSVRLRLEGDVVGDRASIVARYKTVDPREPLTPPPPPPSSRRPGGSVPPGSRSGRGSQRPPSIAEEVDRILQHAPRESTGSWRPKR